MFFHASQVANITELEPRISNHGVPLIYFSRKRENVLVYLSNDFTEKTTGQKLSKLHPREKLKTLL